MPVLDAIDTPILSEFLQFPIQGMVDNKEPYLLTPAQAARLLNCDLTIEGAHRPNNGLLPWGCPTFATRGFGIGAYDAPGASNPRVIISKWDDGLYRCDGTSISWFKCSSGQSLASTYYGFTVFGVFLLAYSTNNQTNTAAETYAPVIRLDSTGGWLNTCFSNSTTHLPPRQLINFNSRLWGIRENRLAWGTVNSAVPPTFLDAANRILWNDYDRNVALAPARDATPRLFIFRDNSVWLLDVYWTSEGYGATTSSTLDFTQAKCRPILESVGLVSTRAVAWSHAYNSAAGDYIWLARDGIHSMSRDLAGGQAGSGRPLSHRIQTLIDRINWDRADTSCAASWKGITYFAVPIDGAKDPNHLICYDQNRDAFFEDDKAGVSFTRARWGNNNETRFFIQGATSCTETLYPTGATTSSTAQYGPNIYQTDVRSGENVLGTRMGFGGTPYSYREETRALTFDLDNRPGSGLQYQKRWLTTHLSFQAGVTTATISLFYKIDSSSTWDVLAYIPLTGGTTGTFKRSFSLFHIPAAYRLQFAIEDLSSYADWKLLEWFCEAIPLNPAFGR